MTWSRTSPVHEQLDALQPQWEERGGMRVAAHVGANDAAMLDAVAIADLSYRTKCGLKGPQAEQWLRSRGIALPEGANAWMALPGGGMVARLGRSEFFLEDGPLADAAGRVRRELGTGAPGAYPVMRQDAGFALAGRRVNDLLVQACNVNFEAFGTDDATAVMTQMIGVAVLVVRAKAAPVPCYRIWCDPTVAPYFWQTLHGIATELGGGAVGANAVPA